MQPQNNHISQQSPHKQKITLQKHVNKKNDLTIDENLMNKAINKSYLKQMVGSNTLSAEEVVNTVSNFVLSFIPQIDI